MKRYPASTPTRSDLEAFAGTYYSEELGATWTVRATDSTLVFKTRGGIDRHLRPTYGDVFLGDFLVAFTRDPKRKVIGLLMSSGRVRNVRFVRSGVQ
jgi:hypothetical protein